MKILGLAPEASVVEGLWPRGVYVGVGSILGNSIPLTFEEWILQDWDEPFPKGAMFPPQAGASEK